MATARTRRSGRSGLVVVAVLVLGGAGWLAVADGDSAGGPEAPAPSAVPGSLLQQAPNGDGDSWKDTRGVEYRLGLVNAPEVDECFGSEATRQRRQLLADGFRARPYSRDRYGRAVSEVFTADGRNLALLLARGGYVDDRYLDQFADENPELAAELRHVFAAARQSRAGLWGACPR